MVHKYSHLGSPLGKWVGSLTGLLDMFGMSLGELNGTPLPFL
jgi:hypothetical protein